MSRGIGKVQREIIDTLNQHGPYYLAAIADGDMGARYKALHRAALGLENTGKIGVVRYITGQQKFAIVPHGVERTEASSLGGHECIQVDIDRKDIERNSESIAKQRGRG